MCAWRKSGRWEGWRRPCELVDLFEVWRSDSTVTERAWGRRKSWYGTEKKTFSMQTHILTYCHVILFPCIATFTNDGCKCSLWIRMSCGSCRRVAPTCQVCCSGIWLKQKKNCWFVILLLLSVIQLISTLHFLTTYITMLGREIFLFGASGGQPSNCILQFLGHPVLKTMCEYLCGWVFVYDWAWENTNVWIYGVLVQTLLDVCA